MNDKIHFSIPIPPDEEGYTGRECPYCERYFKIKFGTGIPEEVPCHCPYCGHTAPHDEFWTKDQIEYAKSVALHKISGDLLRELKRLEVKPKKNAFISIGIQVKGQPTPIAYYSEKELEQNVKCEKCTLEYTIYGAFGFCPDCGVHNSLQIFNANLNVIEKMLHLAKGEKGDVRDKLTENALEDAISAFDGFGRELCKVHSAKASNPQQAEKISFQNISSARSKIEDLFGFDFADSIDDEEWNLTVEQFQKRHLTAHKMGVIDEDYVRRTNVPPSLIGKKVSISEEEVVKLLNRLRIFSSALFDGVA